MQTFKTILGEGGGHVLDTGVPVLGSGGTEVILPTGVAQDRAGAFALFATDDWLVGGVSVPVAGDPGGVGLSVYQDLLAAARDWNLARIWNYVPAINDPGADTLENYRAFSRGRSLAFEERFGPEFARFVPAASAVGTSGDRLTVIFAAHRGPVNFLENALQTPAYRYPSHYGPRSPSFARAAVAGPAGRSTVFVSGTAAVRGHATVAPHNTMAQLECTLENMQEISATAGPAGERSAAPTRFFKVYLRHESDFAAVAAELERHLLQPDDVVHYLRSDICRSDLNVEIESTTGTDPVLVV